MTDSKLSTLPLNDVIRLRWVLRDIVGRRSIISPPDPTDVERLVQMGYVSIDTGTPIVTPEGMEEIFPAGIQP